jgi:hypothetical protein
VGCHESILGKAILIKLEEALSVKEDQSWGKNSQQIGK